MLSNANMMKTGYLMLVLIFIKLLIFDIQPVLNRKKVINLQVEPGMQLGDGSLILEGERNGDVIDASGFVKFGEQSALPGTTPGQKEKIFSVSGTF